MKGLKLSLSRCLQLWKVKGLSSLETKDWKGVGDDPIWDGTEKQNQDQGDSSGSKPWKHDKQEWKDDKQQWKDDKKDDKKDGKQDWSMMKVRTNKKPNT